MTARELHRHLKAMRRRVERNLDVAVSRTAHAAMRHAVKLSSGTFVARGEYARRDPRPPQDPAIINVQSGAFRSAWTVKQEGDKWVLENDSPHADFMLGTRLMIERPILQRVEAWATPVLERNVTEALRRALDK